MEHILDPLGIKDAIQPSRQPLVISRFDAPAYGFGNRTESPLHQPQQGRHLSFVRTLLHAFLSAFLRALFDTGP
jgi:hypothetical protein